MKHLLVFTCIWMILPCQAQTGEKYLYLQNTANDKVKRLNLEKTAYFNVFIDSTGDSFESSTDYYTKYPSESAFGKEEVILKFSQYSTYTDYYSENESNYYTENFIDLTEDSTARLKYFDETSDRDFYFIHQTRFRRFMFSFGVSIFCASVFNAFIVSPMIGMNNGTFQNYSWNRLWKSELYSGLGLAVSIPISILFFEKTYHLQTTSSYYSTWRVVDGE